MNDEGWNPVLQKPDKSVPVNVRLSSGAESVASWTGQQWNRIEERDPEGGSSGYSWFGGVVGEITHWRPR